MILMAGDTKEIHSRIRTSSRRDLIRDVRKSISGEMTLELISKDG